MLRFERFVFGPQITAALKRLQMSSESDAVSAALSRDRPLSLSSSCLISHALLVQSGLHMYMFNHFLF